MTDKTEPTNQASGMHPVELWATIALVLIVLAMLVLLLWPTIAEAWTPGDHDDPLYSPLPTPEPEPTSPLPPTATPVPAAYPDPEPTAKVKGSGKTHTGGSWIVTEDRTNPLTGEIEDGSAQPEAR